ncbi:MAG: SusC/RagA family TonB-linked outer membrane protein [Chitinophagaceae bacterium]|nr:SusC/RagA family TonB-linked outer membrane protein [Chitinophagaceae bacterium]
MSVLMTVGQTFPSKGATNLGADSIVHVAYRNVQRKDLAGAISVLNPPQYLDKHYGTNPTEGMGAFIGGGNLWNLGAGLILVDGEPRALSDVTANEIEQITFLKGANAVVLYGARAANGVMLITTKRGRAGVHGSSVRVNTGINVPKSYPKYLGSAEYMSYYNQASLNDGLPAPYADSTIKHFADRSNPYRYPDVDYFSQAYLRRLYNTYSANAEFTSGTERARFYALAGFQSQNSLLNFGEGRNERNNRLNLRGNIDLKLNNFISTYVNVSTVFSNNRRALGNFWSQANNLQPQRFSPLIPIGMVAKNSPAAQASVKDSRNIIGGMYILGGAQQYLSNPVADVYAAGYDNFTSRQFQYTNGIDVDLRNVSKGLSFHGQMTIDYSNMYDETLNNSYAVYEPTWSGDSITQLVKYNKDSKPGTQNLSNTWSDQLIDFSMHLDYVNTFKDKHNVSAILMADALRRRQSRDFQYRTNANLGIQLGYNFDHKYYADFSGAVVNSTKLPARTRVAFSPTVSLGWVLSEEAFLRDVSWVDRLKLGASAGIINTDLDINSYYLYNAVYSPTAYFSWADGTYTNQATTISRGENLNLSYAKRKEVNLSIEGSFFKKKLALLTTLFFINKDGIPVQNYSQYPGYFFTTYPTTSFVPYSNFQADRYQGLDLQLNFHQDIGHVRFTLGAALTYVTTKAIKRDELYTDAYRNRAGKPIDAIFGLRSEGLFADQNDINAHATQKFGTVRPGDIKFKDQNGDGVIDERDEVMIGRWNSPLTGGVNLTAEYKGFTLFVLGTAYFGGAGIRNGGYYWVSGAAKYSEVVRNSWTESTKGSATYPRLTTTSGDNNFRYSDYWTYSTNGFNISKVQLTYALPGSVLKNSFVKGLNIYVSGNDLLMLGSNRRVMELNIGTMPQTRFYNFGVKGEF